MVVRSSFRPRPPAVSVGSHQRNPRRQRIFGDRVIGANLRAEHARKRATEAAREADAIECLLWSEQMEGFGVTCAAFADDHSVPRGLVLAGRRTAPLGSR
jgi:hypothetical protein